MLKAFETNTQNTISLRCSLNAMIRLLLMTLLLEVSRQVNEHRSSDQLHLGPHAHPRAITPHFLHLVLAVFPLVDYHLLI